MNKLSGVCICGMCGAVFDDVTYIGQCPECRGVIALHITAKGLLNAIIDGEVLDLLNSHTDSLQHALAELETSGYRFDPHADGFHRLRGTEE